MPTTRSRTKFDALIPVYTPAVSENGTVWSAVTGFEAYDFRSMNDHVSFGWSSTNRAGIPPDSEVPKGKRLTLSAAMRQGIERADNQMRRVIPLVQSLNFTVNSTYEARDRLVFNTSSTKSITLDGTVLQALQVLMNVTFATNTVPSYPSLDTLAAVAASKVLTDVSDPEYAFGESIAEIDETLRTIKQPLHSVRRLMKTFLHDVKKKKIHNKRLYAAHLSSVWNEYRFAVAPLIRTADDALAASADFFHRRYSEGYLRYAHSLEATASSMGTRQQTRAFPWPGYTTNFAITSQKNLFSTRHVTVGIKAFHRDRTSVSTLIGLRFRDLPATAWEIFPLTFLVDRVYDVRSWLSASSSFLSSNVGFSGGWVTKRQSDVTDRAITRVGGTLGQNSVTPARTNHRIDETFSMIREVWVPTVSDARPPQGAGKLVSSLTSTTDLTSVILSRVAAARKWR